MSKTKIIVGIDEVGRGSWAGPLVVGAVAIGPNNIPTEVKDSKLLDRQKRSMLAEIINQRAVYCKTGWVWPAEIDEVGLTLATSMAIKRAIGNFIQYDELIIDGSINFLMENPKARCLIKADSLVPEVSAASIIAKCERDRYMSEQGLIFPEYGFEKHVGYGTALHRQAIILYGLTVLHRLTFKPVRVLSLQNKAA